MSPADPDGPGFDLDAGAGEVHRFSHEAMASVFEVRCAHPDGVYAEQAAREAFALVDRLEQELSRFIANSDVSRINGLAAGETTRVHPRTLECLGIARHLYELSGHAFDVCVGTGWERLELDPDRSSVRALETGARVDLGGIGKGYAVDRMAELLLEWDVPRALVHGGFSSVRALEAPPRCEGWPIRMRVPGEGRELGRTAARHLALGASGVLKGEHIRDPRTGAPATGRTAAWVAVDADPDAGQSPAAVADALSTAFMLLEDDAVRALCERFPQIEAWLVPAADASGPRPLLHLARRR